MEDLEKYIKFKIKKNILEMLFYFFQKSWANPR